MQKNYPIKWRTKDEKRLTNYVRKFNTKITKLVNQVPMLADFLPNKLNVKELRSGITNRKDFNDVIKSVDNFFKKGATDVVVNKSGVKTTKYQKKEVERKLRRVNRNRKKLLDEMNPTTEKGTMGSIRENNLKPKTLNFDTIRPDAWRQFVKSVEKQSRYRYRDEMNQLYKENYLKGFDNIFGDAYPQLRKRFEGLDEDVLAEMLFQDPTLELDFLYSKHEQDMVAGLINDHLNDYLNEDEEFEGDFTEEDLEDPWIPEDW